MDTTNPRPRASQTFNPPAASTASSSSAWMGNASESPPSPWTTNYQSEGSMFFSHTLQFPNPPSGLRALEAAGEQVGTSPPQQPGRSYRGSHGSNPPFMPPASSAYWSSALHPQASRSSDRNSVRMPSVGDLDELRQGFRPESMLHLPNGTHNVWSRASLVQPLFPQAPLPAPDGIQSHPDWPSYTLTPNPPPRTSNHARSVSSYRASRSVVSSPPAPLASRDSVTPSTSTPPERRRQAQAFSRVRRSMASRSLAASDHVGSREDPLRRAMATSSATRAHLRNIRSDATLDGVFMRQIHAFRGALSSKMVASRAALQSLQSVDLSELSENERTCVICYNEYGTESPEGINEAPLRLVCKHVFGDHCIKKWFEDSDSCPYCRHKVQAEPKHYYGSARAFMNLMRMRDAPLPLGFTEDAIESLMQTPMNETDWARIVDMGFHGLHNRVAERRSPPDDTTGEDQRRTRPRYNGPHRGHLWASERGAATDTTATAASEPLSPTSPLISLPEMSGQDRAWQPVPPLNSVSYARPFAQGPIFGFSAPANWHTSINGDIPTNRPGHSTADQSEAQDATAAATLLQREASLTNPLQMATDELI